MDTLEYQQHTIENFADKAPELVAYMQSVAQQNNDTLPFFRDITVSTCEYFPNRWDIHVGYEPGEYFYSFSTDKQFAELLQNFVNKELGLDIIVMADLHSTPNLGDLSTAILPGFNTEEAAQEWYDRTKLIFADMEVA